MNHYEEMCVCIYIYKQKVRSLQLLQIISYSFSSFKLKPRFLKLYKFDPRLFGFDFQG